jgi:pSer/pThr/pTyr-binding forkhead associated (FHA) protein
MTGRFVVRSGGGAIAEHPIRPRFTIGSGAPSDVVVDGAEVQPVHATVEIRDGRCWIEAAGGGTIVINGQPADRKALRHLDVVTLGAVHLIFCASTAHPPPARTERAAVVPAPRAGRAAETVHGVPVSAFNPQEPSSTATTIGMPVGGPPPPFSPSATQSTAKSPVAVPPFTPEDTQVLSGPVTGAIRAIRLHDAGGSYQAPIGTTLIGRGPQSAIRIDRPEVSRAHAMLTVSATLVTIEDLASARGTLVNGTRIWGVQALADGDVVTIGKRPYRVEFERAGGAA